MSSPNSKISQLLSHLKQDFPSIKFAESDHFRWEPANRTIHYTNDATDGHLSVLHEIGHMLLGHSSYNSDFELLKMEVLAWGKAQHWAEKYGIDISSEHVEKCLDSYREWLHRRSKCRSCEQIGIEESTGQYSCLNCGFAWQVTPERFCRVYRKQIEPSI